MDELAAGSIHALMHQLIEERVAGIIDRLVVSHRNRTISDQEALSGIATIAGLRALLTDLSAKVKTLH